MADFGSPVATSVNVSPNQGLQTLSAILGLQQQKQALQTGQYTQQSAQASAQGEQQAMQERQNWQKAVQSGQLNTDQPNPATGKTELDPNKAIAYATRLPLTGQKIAQSILETQSNKVGLQAASATLDSQERSMLSGIAGAQVGNPKATAASYGAAVDNLVPQHPEMAPAAAFAKNLAAHIDGMPTQQAKDEAWQHLELLHSAPGTVAAAALPSNAAVQTGAQTVMGPQAPAIAGGQFHPTTAVANQLTPGERLPGAITTPTGVVNRNPVTGALSAPAQAGAPGAPNLNPSQAQTHAVVGLADTDTARYAQVSQEGTNAATGAQLADQVARLAEQVRTGKLSKEYADQLTTLQQHNPNITARQMLSKYAAQLKTMATENSTTDASRSQIEQGMPTPETMGPDAVKEAAQYVGGIFRMRGARQAAADQYVKNAGSPMGVQAVDNAFMQSATPQVFAYKSLAPGAERQEFLKRNGLTTPEKLQAFKSQINQVTHYSGQ